MSYIPMRPIALVPRDKQLACSLLDEQQVLERFCSATLPFSSNDITAGSETELQASVEGQAEDVDLALVLKESNYFLNMQKRAAAGESPERSVDDLQEFLLGHPSRIWENSWVRIPLRLLASEVREMFERDCVADKENPRGESRSDRKEFFVHHHGEACLRVPVSYLLKLSLQQTGARKACPSSSVRKTASTLLAHFLNDNSSPETFSLYVTPLHRSTGMGRAIAAETAKRFFLSHLLILHANETFGLRASGQRALIYFAPHPPVRQKRLNTLIPDSLYRELFMNPCLSGWRRGEEKLRYMHLCHQVLSRSQLNAVIKLRDAGIITRNLVVLPSTSNISLANNGTHLSLGSLTLTGLLSDSGSRFTPAHEKFLGDLAIKIVEHFLPLFVGTYSAAPYRFDFCDFHPERALGFLPHELDGTHLRMLWRRWKKKAKLSVFGQPMTPVGPVWLDRLTSALLGLRGDYVPDFRLIDYLVSLMSTDQSPALDGVLGNEQRLKRDLAQSGVFDESMSLYLLFKLRSQSVIGFSGFEGRHYSLFPSLLTDLGDAATLQALLTGLAFKYMATGVVRHADIPDDPTTESERRQFIFASALGLNTCNVRIDGPNQLLARILSHTPKTRPSHRYADHLRVRVAEYRQALLGLIREDAADLVEAFGAEDLVERLQQQLIEPESQSAAGRITTGILSLSGAVSPLDLTAQEFNESAEQFYRETLRRRHVEESIALVLEDLRSIDDWRRNGTGQYRQLVTEVLGRPGRERISGLCP